MVAGISVVIPNYNGVHLFDQTLPTVEQALQNAGKPSEIIVVDDCSTDGSVEYLLKNYPSVKVIVNPRNRGFSATCNFGAATAKYDKILLLNSDVKLTPTYFNNQLRYFDKPDTFGVMGRIIGWEDEKIQDGAKLPTFHGVKLKTSGNYLLKDETQMQDGLYSMYLSGANAFVDKEKFLLLSGFNELFSPFYSEDVDLSLRAWRLGFKCYYDYNSVCKHQVTTTIKASCKKKFINTIYNRNKLFLHALHLDGATKLAWYSQLMPELLMRVVTFNFSYVQSLQLFLQKQKEVKTSREEFERLAAKLNTRKTVQEVSSFIRDSIKGKALLDLKGKEIQL
ncbi:glycosyltransferase family 2 protein [Pontibacter burrus]|uniref:Glycosyltransferase family 2 protein n=1 Tax=Pontibacter burrus TaxID=2704466 RepID=A0A6B3LRB9_9BACT|nr:glycosyltransferase family 2 protein [Pontibacter burrus]NEM96746.1 glycosyltransferase family 2 protein [Pontibacter burrus]